MIGASRETVSRAMKDFQDANWVTVERRRITLADRPALEARAQAKALTASRWPGTYGHDAAPAFLGDAWIRSDARSAHRALRRQHAVRRGSHRHRRARDPRRRHRNAELGQSLVDGANGSPIAGDIFLSHAHWDHIQGIPFFAPIFERGNQFTIWGATSLRANVGRVVRDQMSPVVFPVTFDSLPARVEFAELTDGPHIGDGYSITAFSLHHPGGALAYRVTDTTPGGRSFVHVSDNELAPHSGYGDDPGWRDRLVDFVRGAAMLVHDATYTPEEYERHRGW